MKNAVFSFFNTDSGMFSWWDEFPNLITKELAKYNVNHTCFYRSYTVDSIYPIDEQNPFPGDNLSDLHWLNSIGKQTNKYEKVIFHTHSCYPPNKINRLTFLKKNRYWYLTEHRIASTKPEPLKCIVRSIGRKFEFQPSKVFGVSKATVTRAKQLYGNKNVVLAYNGIRLINPDTNNEKDRPILKQALFAGRLVKDKGGDKLVQAFKILKERGEHVHLTIVGKGNLYNELDTYISTHNLRNYITLAGYEHDMSKYYKNSDFLIIPSVFKEPFCLVSIEGRMYDLPAIYSNRGGLIETREDNVNGKLINNISPTIIADAVSEMINDPDRFEALRLNCRKDLEKFSIEKMIDVYTGEYLKEFGITKNQY